MSHGSEQVIGQEQDLTCKGAGDVTGGSGPVQVGMNTWLVQVVMIAQRAEPLVGQEQVVYRRAACDVSCGSGAVQVAMDMCLVQVPV